MLNLVWHSATDYLYSAVVTAIARLEGLSDDAEQAQVVQIVAQFIEAVGESHPEYLRVDIPAALDNDLRRLHAQAIALEAMCPREHRKHLEALLIVNKIDPSTIALDVALRCELILGNRGDLTYPVLRERIDRQIQKAQMMAEDDKRDNWLMNMSDDEAATIEPPLQSRRKILLDKITNEINGKGIDV